MDEPPQPADGKWSAVTGIENDEGGIEARGMGGGEIYLQCALILKISL